MAIYGTPLTMGGGGGGQNETLPPLLDNFKATRLEGGIVPPTANTLAFKDIPDGSKIKLVKGNNISGTVTYGTTTDLNHRIVFDSNDWTKKEFQLENDSSHNNISGSDIDQWLNSTKASGWWTKKGTNLTSPDYSNEQGFLYQLGITDELLAQNFNDININATAKAKVGLPWRVSYHDDIPYTFFKDVTILDFADYASLCGDLGNDVLVYNKPQTKAPSQITLYNVTAKIHPMMEPKPDTKVALDVDGSYFMFENQAGGIILSADKMPVSRANALAGAVWVYGEHEPKNVNDGTKVNLTREEIVLPEEGDTDIPPISYTELERPTSTKTWTATEDGYYKFVGVAEAGRSGTARRIAGASYNVSGGSGGSGGIVASVFKLKRGESVSLAIASGDVTISYGSETANATHGQDGGSSSSEPDNKVKLGSPGRAGTATGGNLINMNGKYGDLGERLEGNKATIVRGGETVYEKHISRGGYAQSTRQEGDMVPADRGTTAYIAVLKGNDSSNEALNFTAKASKTIADLPSKTKVKLGKYGSKDLIWLTTKNNAQEQFLSLSPESTAVSPFAGMMLDNAEPTNPNSARKKSGSNRYIQSNLHQWLNSDKAEGEWYTAQHEYDAPPDYANIRGFLYEWSDVEKVALMNRQWKVDKAKLDGSGSETFFAKVVIPSIVELGYTTYDSSEFLDIFKTDDDRVCNDKNWWLRSPYTDYDDTNVLVYQYGSKYQYPVIQKHLVRPLVNIDPYTPVSESPDSDGCYTLMLSKPIDPNAIVTKNILWDTNKNFYARQFTYNSKKQYQTMLEGATTELLLGEAPLSVSNLTISENAGASPTLSWKNPTDKNYYETVVVQKEGSTPRSTDDGIEVYRGNGESVTVKDLQSTVDYSFGVFTLSPYGNYGEPATISYRYDFPSEPTSYIEIEKITNTTQWVAPEDGYFKFIGLAKSGDGGSNDSWNTTVYGGSGGTGGIVASVFRLQKNDVVSITITNNVTIKSSNETATATSGGNGTGGKITHPTGWSGDHGKGGAAGSASGGNLANVTGRVGQNGASSGAGSSYTNSYSGYSTTSGAGGANNSGTNAYAVILRGNTNTPSPQ